MAKLYEFQGKSILQKFGVAVPEGKAVEGIEEAINVSNEIGFPVVVKIQTWSTGRAALGGVQFANSIDELKETCENFFKMKVGNFNIERLLIEKKLNIVQEFFVGFIINGEEKKPTLIFSSKGGSGIEEIAKEYPESLFSYNIDVIRGLKAYEIIPLLIKVGVDKKLLNKMASTIIKLYNAMRGSDARSLETNPLVLTEAGKIVAADAHIVIDDYGVFRHPEFGIEIAREFDRPPTELEKIAYLVEKNDYRGTFYFFQMNEKLKSEENYIGFHGAGGGGSMMSMDAVAKKNYKIANFCDTSGNPPASKVYKAAKIILSQPNITGYFASGSGVASQEQFHSARGFVKAFLEESLDVPAVLRLGGNSEEIAIDILNKYLGNLNVKVLGYGKNDSPDFCMDKLDELIKENGKKSHRVKKIKEKNLDDYNYKFETMTGSINIDHNVCKNCPTQSCVKSCNYNILKIEDGVPVLAIEKEDVKKGKCIECLACEIACKFNGRNGLYIHLPIEGLKEYREKITKE